MELQMQEIKLLGLCLHKQAKAIGKKQKIIQIIQNIAINKGLRFGSQCFWVDCMNGANSYIKGPFLLGNRII